MSEEWPPPRRYERCAECRRRVMLPRWVDSELYAGDTGAEWYCMDCSGETPEERIEWARDEAEATAEMENCSYSRDDDLYGAEQRATVATIRAAEPLSDLPPPDVQ